MERPLDHALQWARSLLLLLILMVLLLIKYLDVGMVLLLLGTGRRKGAASTRPLARQ